MLSSSSFLAVTLITAFALVACNAKTLVVVADDGDGGASRAGVDSGTTPSCATAPNELPDGSCSGSADCTVFPVCTAETAMVCETQWACSCTAGQWSCSIGPNSGFGCSPCPNYVADTDASTDATDCQPACASTEVCVKAQMLGGVFVPADDAGACPPGRHLEGGSCEPDPTFSCAPKPAACGSGALDCTCAADLCTSIQTCGYTCNSTTGDQVDCRCLTP